MAVEQSTSLTPDLEDLLRGLGGERPDLHFDGTYGDYFREDGAKDSDRASIRFEVLRALENCKSFEKFDFTRVDQWNLSSEEWGVLLTPLQSNGHIRDIQVWDCEHLSTYVRTLIEHSLKLRRLTLSSCFEAAAEGLEANTGHQLNHLTVGSEEEWIPIVRNTGRILQCAPSLEELIMIMKLEVRPREVTDVDELAMEFSQALQRCPCLKTLHLFRFPSSYNEYVERIDAELLTRMYAQSASHPTLQTLVVAPNIDASTLSSLVSRNIQRIELEIVPPAGLMEGEWHSVGEALNQAPTLQSLHLCVEVRVDSDTEDLLNVHYGENSHNMTLPSMMRAAENLEAMWSASGKSPLLHIAFHLSLRSSGERTAQFLEKCLADTYLREFTIDNFGQALNSVGWLADLLAVNQSIQRLTIISYVYTEFLSSDSKADAWGRFLIRLKENKSLRRLELEDANWTLTDGNFKQTLDLLQINPNIEEIDVRQTEWAEDGRQALIQQALKRNKEQAEYFSALSAENLKFDGAKAGRIFLCGPPFAGKSQLKATMMKTLQGKRRIRKKIPNLYRILGLDRTKGIEVELLVDDEIKTISIWDLGGQDIFRALQNIVFPRLNQALLFVFVFNPFEDNRKALKSDLYDAFEKEMRKWLRFIVSNTQVRGEFLVQIQVIVTHLDKHKRGKSEVYIDILEELAEKVSKDYEGAAKLCFTTDGAHRKYVRHINAKSWEQVTPVKDLLLSLMEEELQFRTKSVPKVCSKIASHLLKLPPDVRECPVWDRTKFRQYLLSDWVPKYIAKISDMSEERKRCISECIESYLHNIGAIYLVSGRDAASSIDWVVLDLNWLTRDLIGELVSQAYQFNDKSGESKAVVSEGSGQDNDGILTSSEFTAMIRRTLQASSYSLEAKTLIEILLNIGMCYRLETPRGEDRYFAPLFCRRQSTSTKLLSWGREFAGDSYFGLRIAVHDNRTTSFTASFYPTFQIHLRRLLGSQGVTDGNFVFSRDHVKFHVNDCEIFVEVDRDEFNHVDILVKFSGHQRRECVMEYVQKHVVAELVDFCASDKGCPGVQTVLWIIRTECVRKLIPLASRENQVVLATELKKQLVAHIDDRLGSGETEEKNFIDYKYTWPQVAYPSRGSTHTLDRVSEPVQNLLPRKQMNEVLQHVKEKFQNVSEAHSRLQREEETLKRIESELTASGPVAPSSKSEPEPLTSTLISRPSFVKREKMEQTLLLCMNNQTYYITKQTRQLTERFQQLQNDLRGLANSLNQLGALMESTTRGVDKLIRFVTSRETATPRRPYFTTHDVSYTGKMKAFVTMARPIRLHLMCEARDGPHVVEEQEGLEISMEKQGKYYAALRKLSVISMQMFWVLLTVGVQVTTGLGALVPDLTNLETGLAVGASGAAVGLVLNELKAEVDKSLPSQEESQMAWEALKYVLAEYLEPAKCAEVFRLHKVIYRNCDDDPFAWLCSSCMEAGKRNLLLERTWNESQEAGAVFHEEIRPS